MFRDAKEELERLNQQLLDAENEPVDQGPAPQPEDAYEEAPLEEEDDTAYSDWEEDLYEETDDFEAPPPRKSDRTLLAAILLLITGLVLLTAWMLAKRRGLV